MMLLNSYLIYFKAKVSNFLIFDFQDWFITLIVAIHITKIMTTEFRRNKA